MSAGSGREHSSGAVVAHLSTWGSPGGVFNGVQVVEYFALVSLMPVPRGARVSPPFVWEPGGVALEFRSEPCRLALAAARVRVILLEGG